MEGHWETGAGQPLLLFGWPDMEAETTRYKIEIPSLGSYILTHDWNGTVKGLKAWPRNERPNATILFWSFRIMVGLGVLMILVGAWSSWLRLRGRLTESTALLRLAVLMGPSGFVAVLAGWITTEVGRQPYTVYGLLRTVDSVSPIDAAAVGASLIAFIVVYFLVFGASITVRTCGFTSCRMRRAVSARKTARSAVSRCPSTPASSATECSRSKRSSRARAGPAK